MEVMTHRPTRDRLLEVLKTAVGRKLRPPVGILLGSPREAAEIAAGLEEGPVVCYQMDLYQAERLEGELRERAAQDTLPFGRGHLALYGWGSGPTVLLVHGWGARGTHLGKMVMPLVAAGYRVVAFDAPGHGHSSGRSATLPQFASAIATVAAHVGEIHALVAHSFGVAMALWAQLDWGMQVRRQVLFSSLEHCKWVTEEFARLMRLPESVLARGRQLMVERSQGAMDWERLAVGDMLAQTVSPTLLVHDAEDPEVPIEHMFQLMTACAQRPLELHVTEGLGHHRLLGNRDVIDRLVAFIGAPQAA